MRGPFGTLNRTLSAGKGPLTAVPIDRVDVLRGQHVRRREELSAG